MLEETKSLILKDSRKDNIQFSKEEIVEDLWICYLSREVSLLARRDVLNGRGKFAIYGDGKELAQIALAKTFQDGDHRSGYYRDQTIMFALGLLTVETFFAQLYTDAPNDPFSGGRQMNAHFSTPYLDADSRFINQLDKKNISSDISCTAGQMARGVGLALASKKYRELKGILDDTKFSNNGNEVCFCTIGDASSAEGPFFESINAISILQIPLAINVWDDGYGISVPAKYQIAKESISDVLRGFEKEDGTNGIRIFKVKGWDYSALVKTYDDAIQQMRFDHVPAIIHVEELTQPQGHSTSGSHERYKSKERLQWEKDHDCIKKFESWVLENNICTETELRQLRNKAKERAREGRENAWNTFRSSLKGAKKKVQKFVSAAKKVAKPAFEKEILRLEKEFKHLLNPFKVEYIRIARQLQYYITADCRLFTEINAFLEGEYQLAEQKYHDKLLNQSATSVFNVPEVAPVFSENSATVPGYKIISAFFDQAFTKHKNLIAFGEDVGQIGDVNQGFAGLQKKHGVERIFDTGIREWTIIGQAIGMAMRGLRPIAEVQYLDYLIYCLPPLSDDLASMHYRSNGTQISPAIIRTRGHRLEGIWHSGSPMGMILNALRGVHVCVPRNMVQACGMYQTLLQSNDPALVIEVLNGYRLRERKPDNLEQFTVPLGVPEVLRSGTDLTLVTYGACVRIAQDAAETLEKLGISIELIDIQTLLPFDTGHLIRKSVEKTNRLLVLDEDVPGGASAYILQQILEKQDAYHVLDSKPQTISAHPHRPPYGTDGDYFSKPNVEDIVERVYSIMAECRPAKYNQVPFKIKRN